ncbi:DNA-directed RNA polymerase III, subunit Rpc31 [Xylariales sp. PMI_506]|nr:DNA-directed RNA polymerase III, subunit Rpc31 [Xylariales sp. PMI_506]
MATRGGRGGFRGGRGGAQGGKKAGPAGLPWDYDPSALVPEPLETYPKSYNPPVASRFPLLPSEARAARYFVQFRRDFHDSGLYTHKHLAPDSSSASANISDPVSKYYDQRQINERFGVKSKATIDPFLNVPMYSHQFVHEARSVPEFKSIDPNHDLFPEELWATLDGKDGGAPKTITPKTPLKRSAKRKSIAGEDPFEDDEDIMRRKRPETDEERRRRIEEAAQGRENEDDAADEELDEDEAEMTQEDDDFEDDEDGGDYNAEQYFDDGADDMEDEGVGETAMDF